jgi:hypothetical protein
MKKDKLPQTSRSEIQTSFPPFRDWLGNKGLVENRNLQKPSCFVFCLLIFLLGISVHSLEVSPEMGNLTRFDSDFVSFHYVHTLDESNQRFSGADSKQDPSVASLVVVKDSQTYIFRDGYDEKLGVRDRMRNLQAQISEYRKYKSYLKDFRDLSEEKRKEESKPAELRIRKVNFEPRFENIFLRYDEVLREISGELKKAKTEEYRAKRYSGDGSLPHSKSIETRKAWEDIFLARKKFLDTELTRLNANDSGNTNLIGNPGDSSPSQNLPSASDASASNQTSSGDTGSMKGDVQKGNAGQASRLEILRARVSEPVRIVSEPVAYNQFNAFPKTVSGEPNYFSYSRSARDLDLELVESGESKSVSEKYGSVYNKMVERVITGYKKNFLFYHSRKTETDSKVSLETNAQTGGRRVILVTQERTRYVVEDWDGDGKVETFTVSNFGYPSWDANTPNLLSIYNCRKPEYAKWIESILADLDSGNSVSLDDIRNQTRPKDLVASPEDFLRDWNELISQKGN